MRVDEFDYELPKELIAQQPIEPRDASRLMVVRGESAPFEHRHFYELPEYLRAGDCLVLNDTKVVPARLLGRKVSTGARLEVLLVRPVGDRRWEALIRRNQRAKPGTVIEMGGGKLRVKVVSETLEHHLRLVELEHEGSLEEALAAVGEVPLPPYIKRDFEHLAPEQREVDRRRYQTVFAQKPGAVAAPTAALHFTPELLKRIEAKGVKLVRITLHVSLGTFQPVQVEKVSEHKVHPEYYEVSEEAAEAINAVKEGGGRIIAVGTTAVRTLETVADEQGRVKPKAGETRLFCYPGYEFKVVEGLITNFHLPRSSLLMLVAAFSGLERIRAAYAEAVRLRYRFYSYGDAMLLLPK